jgi:hypothetical protein
MITCYHDNMNNILHIKKYLLSTGDAVTDTIAQACTVSILCFCPDLDLTLKNPGLDQNLAVYEAFRKKI